MIVTEKISFSLCNESHIRKDREGESSIISCLVYLVYKHAISTTGFSSLSRSFQFEGPVFKLGTTKPLTHSLFHTLWPVNEREGLSHTDNLARHLNPRGEGTLFSNGFSLHNRCRQAIFFLSHFQKSERVFR